MTQILEEISQRLTQKMRITAFVVLTFLSLNSPTTGRYDDEWTKVFELEEKDAGGFFIRGNLIDIFEEPGNVRQKVVIVDNKDKDVHVKCENNHSNSKIRIDDVKNNREMTLQESQIGESQIEYILWKKNLTTFWKSEKNLRCLNYAGCSMKVIKIQDEKLLEGNCYQPVEGIGTIWCSVKELLDEAKSVKTSDMDCKLIDFYDFPSPNFEFSSFNRETKRWMGCSGFEYEDETSEAIDNRDINFIKCEASGLKSALVQKSILLRMRKVHKSRISFRRSFLKQRRHDCQESAYFLIPDEGKILRAQSKFLMNTNHSSISSKCLALNFIPLQLLVLITLLLTLL